MVRRPAGEAVYCEVDGVRTHARVYGRGHPVNCVIVPGLGCASWMYLRLAHRLAEHYTVWLYDPPGQGLSRSHRGGEFGAGQMAEHLALWLETQRIRRPVLLGHSLGGEVIFRLAARYPALPCALVAMAPTGIPENPGLLRQVWRLVRDVPRERLGFWPFCLSAYARTGIARFYRLSRAIEHQSALPFLTLLRCPVLVLGGGIDPVVSPRALRPLPTLTPQLHLVELTGAPHAMADANPQGVRDEVHRWLEALRAGSGLAD